MTPSRDALRFEIFPGPGRVLLMPTPPWMRKKAAPKNDKITLTPESIAWAKARAKAAGRRYPNLVDNMAATRRQREAGSPQSERSGP